MVIDSDGGVNSFRSSNNSGEYDPTIMIGPLPATVYILCSFIANAGVSVTGFGMALIFVFVYTIFDVFGMMSNQSCIPQELCDMKYAVFIQSLSLIGSMPFLMYKSNARQNANKYLLQTLIPITLVATPFGQMCQNYISTSWIRMVVGIVVTLVVGYEIYKLYSQRRAITSVSRAQHLGTSNVVTERTSLIPQTEPITDSISKEKVGTTNDDHDVDHGVKDNTNDDNEESQLLHGFSKDTILLWGVVLGFFSGFLGGLIGMRGPPLMIFFLHFSTFPKSEARAVGAVLLFLNMALRVGYYLLQDYYHTTTSPSSSNLQEKDDPNIIAISQPKWFYWESSWHLYLGVIIAGIIGVPIGDWIHHRLDTNKFRLALAILLVASGIVNIVKATSELKGT